MREPARNLWVLAIGLYPALSWAAVDVDGRWHPGIGDPSVVGWMTVVAYIISAALAGRNARVSRLSGLRSGFWIGLCLLLVCLGINKQLDLQSLLTEIGRDMAKSDGWYKERRTVQVIFISVLALAGLGTLALLRHRLAQDWQEYRVAFVGLVLLTLFVMVRAVTFHHIDVMLRLNLAGLRVNVLLELSAIVVVAAGCLRWHKRVGRSARN